MEKILLGHGSGGSLMHRLIKETIAPIFNIKQFSDSAIIDLQSLLKSYSNDRFQLAYTTDSYVVSPLFFPGGNIGDLAINGTINDLSMVGAIPFYISVGFIIEEGFPLEDFNKVLKSMSLAAKNANVNIITGDTKVVDKGKGDGIFINTSGIGIVYKNIDWGCHKIIPGDKIIVSGFIGNHGIAVMAERNGLIFNPPVLSDTASLNKLVESMLKNFGNDIKIMRDPTRGGVATTLKELALESETFIQIYEKNLPILGGVTGASELLGLDPLYIANEGILISIVSESIADNLLKIMKQHPLGANAEIIGEVLQGEGKTKGMVSLKTLIGGDRIIDMLIGEQLPRIC